MMFLTYASKTGVDFQNTIIPTDTLHLLSYEYLYNGGGVGIGDFNNDNLPDLVFTGSMVESKVYINKGNLKFKDVTTPSGFDTSKNWCTGVSIADINNDGYDDIYVCVGGPGNSSTHPNLLFINNQDLTFTESAEEYGLADPNESVQSVFFDFDKDGDLDMYLLNGGGFEKSAIMIRPIIEDGSGRNTDKLYQNVTGPSDDHPIYKDISKEAGITIEGFGLGVSIIDANKDEWSDIYVSNDYLSRDLLYINNQDGTFTEKGLDYFRHMSHFSMGNDVGDINNDGHQDIVTLDMLPEDHYRRKMMFGPNHFDRFNQVIQYGYGHQHMRNMLHLDNGITGYKEIGQYAEISRTDWSWCPLLADYNNDGLLDLYVTNGYGKDITDLDFVKFRKDAASPFADPQKREEILVKNLESRPSITLANYMYVNNGDYTFNNLSKEWNMSHPSISNGGAFADLDNDGDLEIITNNIDRPSLLYKNQTKELDSLSSHFVIISLEGPEKNTDGIGSKVQVYYFNQLQSKYYYRTRGFQSSIGKRIHFGIGKANLIDSIIVTWPDGASTRHYKIPANTHQIIRYTTSEKESSSSSEVNNKYLQKTNIVSYKHSETKSSDFLNQPLLIHSLTNQGPGIAVGDINGNGLDDFYVSGSYGREGTFFVQEHNGEFRTINIPGQSFEELGSVLFDVDKDGDLDLYITSGGTERHTNNQYYRDRIFINDGKGQWEEDPSRIPDMLASTTTVVAGDYDQDGDEDLFVGGRVVPGRYPEVPQSFLLRNEGGKLIDVTEEVIPGLRRVGMVTSAIWTDINNDFRLDLIIAGEMMDIHIYINQKDHFLNITENAGLSQTSGFWSSIVSGDLDNDGDMDYVLGNIGNNQSYNIEVEHPLMLHYGDLDKNGSIDPIFSIFEDNDYYPLASLDQLTEQLPSLKKDYLKYGNYAMATTQTILEKFESKNINKHICELTESIVLQNNGDNTFEIHQLPGEIQWSGINGIITEDINDDNLLDLILVGNNYQMEVIYGNQDASYGEVLINRGNMMFEPMNNEKSGLYTSGHCTSLSKIYVPGKGTILQVGQNQDSLQSYVVAATESKPEYFKLNEYSARLEFTNGTTRKIEYHMGQGGLSQISRSITLSQHTNTIKFYNSRGQETRHINYHKFERNVK